LQRKTKSIEIIYLPKRILGNINSMRIFSMRKFVFTASFLVLGLTLIDSILSEAQGLTINATSDSFISEAGAFNGPSATHGSDPLLYAISTPIFRSFPLVQFDLSSYAGQTVVGTPKFNLWLNGGHPSANGIARPVGVYQVLSNWNASTVSFSTFGSAPGLQFGTDVNSTPLNTQQVVALGGSPQYISWSIPVSTIQGWINNPSSNRGLLIYNLVLDARYDLNFLSLEGVDANGQARPPQLVFDVAAVPAPAAVPWLSAGLVTLSGWIRRNHKLSQSNKAIQSGSNV
jgi:hypothetical protein